MVAVKVVFKFVVDPEAIFTLLASLAVIVTVGRVASITTLVKAIEAAEVPPL